MSGREEGQAGRLPYDTATGWVLLHIPVAGPIVTPANPHPLTGAQLPQTLGHEFSADVLAVGSEVISAKEGDRNAKAGEHGHRRNTPLRQRA